MEKTSKKHATNSSSNRDKNKLKARPLSPHIQIYRWERSMAYSILHRASAVGVGFFTLLLLGVLMLSKLQFDTSFLNSNFAKFVIFIGTLTISYYVFATLKYIIWSTGFGLSIKASKILGDISVALTLITSIWILVWYIL